jgi:hypothetical protein
MKLPILQVSINNQEEIELFELASSMSSISEQYHRFLRQTKKDRVRSDAKLYVQKISHGSIIIDLCEKAVPVLPAIAPLIVEYSIFLANTLDFLTGKAKNIPEIYNYLREDFINFKRILEPVANINGNTIQLTGFNFGKTIINNTYTSLDARAAQNQCDREIKRLEKSGDSLIKENVELRLYQARDSKLSKTTQGNLGILQEISDKPKVLSFANDRVRYDITKGETNPFNFTYSVDVEVKLKEGASFLQGHADIKEYEILKLHGSIANRDLLSEDNPL